jgi:hypothetical protein
VTEQRVEFGENVLAFEEFHGTCIIGGYRRGVGEFSGR